MIFFYKMSVLFIVTKQPTLTAVSLLLGTVLTLLLVGIVALLLVVPTITLLLLVVTPLRSVSTWNIWILLLGIFENGVVLNIYSFLELSMRYVFKTKLKIKFCGSDWRVMLHHGSFNTKVWRLIFFNLYFKSINGQ